MRRLHGLLIRIFLLCSIFFTIPVFSQVWKEPLKDYELTCGKPGGKLYFHSNSDPKSFNPIVAKETSTTQVTGFLFEGLTRTDPKTLEMIPNLARSWDTTDGKEWIFHLRQDVWWSDGKKFTADDVLFTFKELIYNPTIPSGIRDIFTIEGKQIEVTKIDDYTIKFILPSAFAPFLRALGQEILPEHKYGQLVKQGKFTSSMGLGTKPSDIVGTGAFRLKKYFPGERVVLERNPFYWRKDHCGKTLPYLDEIIFAIIPSETTALLKFLEKEIDTYNLRPQELAILGPRQDQGFSIYNLGLSYGTNFVVLNQNTDANPETHKPYVKPYKLQWFRNKNFRKAISFAINRKKIIDLAMNGLGQPQYSPESPANTLFYSDDVVKYPYDPAKAKELLTQLGFADRNHDGILEDKDGHALEINFFTAASGATGERMIIADLIKKDLQDIGMKINFVPLEFNTLVVKLTATYDWEMILIGLTGGIEPYFGKNVWSSKGDLHAWNPTKKALDDYELQIDEIFEASVKTLDIKKRKELFARFQYLVSDNLPLIYTALSYGIDAVQDRFGNLYPTANGGLFPEIESVYIK